MCFERFALCRPRRSALGRPERLRCPMPTFSSVLALCPSGRSFPNVVDVCAREIRLNGHGCLPLLCVNLAG